MRKLGNFIKIVLCISLFLVTIIPLNITYALTEDVISKADKSTVDDYKNVLENTKFGGRYDGRVWTDKSVYVNNDEIIKLDNKFDIEFDDDFLTVFSALGSSQYVEKKNIFDVLMVIDASGSMSHDVVDEVEHKDEETIIAHSRIRKTIDSVNDTIETLMNLNEKNRVAVVVYGATAYTLMELNHYDKADGKDYITIENFKDYTEKELKTNGSNAFTLRVDALCNGGVYKRSVRNNYLNYGNKNNVDALIGYNTNTQAGIYLGFKELYDKASEDIARIPVALVMSDGGANFGLKRSGGSIMGDEWYNVPLQTSIFYYTSNTTMYRTENNEIGTGGKETILETLLTASFMKAKVQKKYESIQNKLEKNVDNKVYFKVHTVSVDTPEEEWQIPRVYTILDPKVYFKKDLNNVDWEFKQDSIDAYKLWEAYKASESITSNFKDSDNRNVNLKINKLPDTIDGVTNEDVIKNISYNDTFNDIKSEDLTNYFRNIIINDLFNPIGDNKNELGEKSIVSYSDEIGQYLEVKDISKLLLFGKEYKIVKDGDVQKVSNNKTRQYYKAIGDDNNDLSITNEAYEEDNAFKLSDIKIWIDKNSTQDILYINIPKVALPIKLDTIELDAFGEVAEYKSNSDTEYALPIRFIYTVGVRSDILNEDNTINQAKINSSYKEKNVYEEDGEKYLYLYANSFSNSSTGDAFITFTPSLINNFYIFQNNSIIYENSSGGDSEGEGVLSETGGTLNLTNPLKDLNDIDKNKTYYYAIEYYVPGDGESSKGKLEKYAIAQKGSDFFDQNNNCYLTYFDTELQKEVAEKNDNTLIATKIGAKRIGNLNKFNLSKEENITKTANYYYSSLYGANINSIMAYLGNNGYLKVKYVETSETPIDDETTGTLDNNPKTGLIISLNALIILSLPFVLYYYSKGKKKLYKVD